MKYRIHQREQWTISMTYALFLSMYHGFPSSQIRRYQQMRTRVGRHVENPIGEIKRIDYKSYCKRAGRVLRWSAVEAISGISKRIRNTWRVWIASRPPVLMSTPEADTFPSCGTDEVDPPKDAYRSGSVAETISSNAYGSIYPS